MAEWHCMTEHYRAQLCPWYGRTDIPPLDVLCRAYEFGNQAFGDTDPDTDQAARPQLKTIRGGGKQINKEVVRPLPGPAARGGGQKGAAMNDGKLNFTAA